MLTNLYYYGYYKDYMVKSAGVAKQASISPKRNTVASQLPASSTAILLNKAFKSDIVSYARDLSKNVVQLKDAAKTFVYDSDAFDKNYAEEGLETLKQWTEQDIEEFTSSYNRTIEFSLRQEHSPGLKQFAGEMEQFMMQNREVMDSLGVDVDENGYLHYNGGKTKSLKAGELKKMMAEAKPFFEDSYEKTNELLRFPLANHMNFKGLGYYYNYKMGSVQDNTFKIIESGLIIDRAV